MTKIISHHFPNLMLELQNVVDPRKYGQYRIEEIIFGAISLFVFKCGSRNAMNNFRSEDNFRDNFYKAFRLRLPQMDTVKVVFEKLNPQELENLKTSLVKHLISNKIFDKWRLDGKILIAVDGTGVSSYDHRHCENCTVHTYKVNQKRKKERKVYFHNVLEAKIVTENGFSISICTEWVENEGVDYDKQDCEIKAFLRLSKKLKANFPRLPICICADGLYPNKTFFEVCIANQWDYIVTLPDKSLSTFWNKIRFLNRECVTNKYNEGNIHFKQRFIFLNQISHNNIVHSWIQTNETQTDLSGKIEKYKFVHLTNIPITHQNVMQVSKAGRLRWKIEKQGFDQQKNHGYNICHKYCRKSYTGLKNFYQCCQMGHLFNQLLELSEQFKELLPGKKTRKHAWICLWGFMIYGQIDEALVVEYQKCRMQFQYKC